MTLFYGVTVIEDHDLPPTHDFAVVRQGSEIMAYIKRTAVTAEVLTDCLEAACRLSARPLKLSWSAA